MGEYLDMKKKKYRVKYASSNEQYMHKSWNETTPNIKTSTSAPRFFILLSFL